jgi:hypothetical protein
VLTPPPTHTHTHTDQVRSNKKPLLTHKCYAPDDCIPVVSLFAQVLEFRACRLTASGLTRLAALPALCALSCHGLDTCLDAATAACFATSGTLQQLHLGCDYEVPEEALQQLRTVAGGLSMCFRLDWDQKGEL